MIKKGRKKPYTDRGINKVPCLRCGKPSEHQWQICSLDNRWFGICFECDIKLNKLVLEFMGIIDTAPILHEYERKQLNEYRKNYIGKKDK